MSKAIEDALNLPRLEDALKNQAPKEDQEETIDPKVAAMALALQNVSDTSLRNLDPTGVNEHVDESDEIYTVALKASQDLMDLGYNIEPKHAGANAFMPALKALEIALKASQSKTTKKMERLKALMEQEKHNKEINGEVEDGEIVDNGGQSITANRNDLMAKIRRGEI
jgi:hypothetical protein